MPPVLEAANHWNQILTPTQPNRPAHRQPRLAASHLRYLLTRRPHSASKLLHCFSCCSPTSPYGAPVSHKTSPGSRAMNVKVAPRKKGLHSVGPASAMNPFELSSGLPARRWYLSSLRCHQLPSGHSRAQCPSLRHLAHLLRSFRC